MGCRRPVALKRRAVTLSKHILDWSNVGHLETNTTDMINPGVIPP